MKTLPAALRLVTPHELAERHGTPFLLYLDDGHRQHIVDLAPDRTLSIGREPASDVQLDWDSEVSRAHAVLERVGGAWTLVDDGLSRNGSFVNEQRVHGRRRLDDGDAIKVGKTLLVYVATAGEVRTTATTTAGAPPEVSPAQQRVLDALCRPAIEGPLATPASNREIAAELCIGVETVKRHMHALFDLNATPQRRDLAHPSGGVERRRARLGEAGPSSGGGGWRWVRPRPPRRGLPLGQTQRRGMCYRDFLIAETHDAPRGLAKPWRTLVAA